MDYSQIPALINKTFDLKFKNYYIEPTYWQAAAIVVLLFLLVWTLARLRYLYVHWSLGKSAISMVFWGFLLAFVLEGFFIIGGKTIFTEILGWENAPKPISTVLDITRNRLVNVLGVTDEIPQSSVSEKPSSKTVILNFQRLDSNEAIKVQEYICEP